MAGSPLKALRMGKPCSWIQNEDQKPGVILRCFYCFPPCPGRTLNHPSHWVQVASHAIPLARDLHMVSIFFFHLMIQDFLCPFTVCYLTASLHSAICCIWQCLAEWGPESGTRSMRELVPQEVSHEVEGPVDHLDEQLVCWEKRECFFRQD